MLAWLLIQQMHYTQIEKVLNVQLAELQEHFIFVRYFSEKSTDERCREIDEEIDNLFQVRIPFVIGEYVGKVSNERIIKLNGALIEVFAQ